MIGKDTVLVLGAGASKPYGYPTGRELVKLIEKNLDPTSKAYKDLINLGYDEVEIEFFKTQLLNSRSYTIDAFLEGRKDEFGEIGKLAIAQVLINKESEDVYSCDENFDWYGYLINSLRTPNPGEFLENKLSIITFNYDRSLEQYLIKSLGAMYSGDSAELIKTIPIIHMYGKLDHLPKEGKLTGKNREYGFIPSGSELLMSSKNIKLIHESEIKGQYSKAKKCLRNANKLYFLGFGYDLTNLDNLKIIDNYLDKNIDGISYPKSA